MKSDVEKWVYDKCMEIPETEFVKVLQGKQSMIQALLNHLDNESNGLTKQATKATIEEV